MNRKVRAAVGQPAAAIMHRTLISGPSQPIDLCDPIVPTVPPADLARREGLSSSDLARHEARCTVCRHPDREAIEEGFIHWHSVYGLCYDFDIPSRSMIYRHARAVGLLEIRRRNVRFALERIIDNADRITPNAHGIVSAVRALTRLTDAGEWLDPPTRVIISTESAPAPVAAPAPPLPPLSGTTQRSESAPDD